MIFADNDDVRGAQENCLSTSEAEEALRRIVAIHEHEGVTPSAHAQDLALAVIKGEIDVEDAVLQILTYR